MWTYFFFLEGNPSLTTAARRATNGAGGSWVPRVAFQDPRQGRGTHEQTAQPRTTSVNHCTWVSCARSWRDLYDAVCPSNIVQIAPSKNVAPLMSLPPALLLEQANQNMDM